MSIYVLEWIKEDLKANGDNIKNYTLKELKPLLDYYNLKFNNQHLEVGIVMELQYGKYKEIAQDPIFKVKVKDLREKKGLSKKKLSDIADISRSIISDIESGKTKNPTCITLIKLARAFNCSIDELVEIEY